MLNPKESAELCRLILEVSKIEKKIEIVRHLLCEYQDFSPYSAFSRLDSRQINRICACDIKQFLEQNNSDITLASCELFIKLYDRDNDLEICFEEFLDAVLPQNNERLRYKTLQRKGSVVLPGEYLQREIEYTLIKLLDWETQGIQELESEKHIFFRRYQGRVRDFLSECFDSIDIDLNGILTVRQMESFFLLNDILIYPEEILAFFRRLSRGSKAVCLNKSDFIAGLDYLPFFGSNRTFTNSLILEQHNRTGPLITGLSRTYNEDLSPIQKSNGYWNTPKKSPIKYPDNVNEEDRDGINKYNLRTPQEKILSKQMSDRKHKSYTKTNEKHIGQQCVQDEMTRQNLLKKLTLLNKQNTDGLNKSCAHNNNKETKKVGLLSFKQDIRGELATSKIKSQKSLSPLNQTKARKRTTSQFNNTSNSYIVVENDQKNTPSKKSALSYRKGMTQTSSNKFKQILSDKYYQNNLSRDKSPNKKTPKRNLAKTLFNQKSFITKQTLRNSFSNLESISNRNITLEEEREQSYTRLNPASAKKTPKRCLKSNIAYYLNEYFMQIIIQNKGLEKLKQELAIMTDFNIYEAFKIIDQDERGIITAHNIQDFLERQNVQANLNEIILFVKRFDTLKLGSLRFSELVSAITSSFPEYRNLLEERQGSQRTPSFQRETLRAYARLLMEHLHYEYQLELLRHSISKEKKWDYEYAFYLVNEHKSGFISDLEYILHQIQHFLEFQNYLPSDIDIHAIIERFDFDQDEVISLNDFITELYPRSII